MSRKNMFALGVIIFLCAINGCAQLDTSSVTSALDGSDNNEEDDSSSNETITEISELLNFEDESVLYYNLIDDEGSLFQHQKMTYSFIGTSGDVTNVYKEQIDVYDVGNTETPVVTEETYYQYNAEHLVEVSESEISENKFLELPLSLGAQFRSHGTTVNVTAFENVTINGETYLAATLSSEESENPPSVETPFLEIIISKEKFIMRYTYKDGVVNINAVMTDPF